MSCGCSDNYNSNSAYNGYCNADTPYPSVSHESVPSLIDNLVTALYGEIQKDVSSGKVVWNIPCDPSNIPATINGIPRNDGEGLLCYIVRALNLTTPSGFVTVNGVQTLTNKTLVSPTITGSGAIAGIFTGNVTGNATTATTIATARTIALSGDVTGTATSFNGSANISIPVTINAGAVTPADLSTGGPTWNANGDLNAQGGQNPLIQAVPNAANGIGAFIAYATNALNAIVGQIQMYCSTSAAVINSVLNLPMVFMTNNAERMRISADGNVGIGTSSPSAKLNIVTGARSLVVDPNLGGNAYVASSGNVNGLFVGTSDAKAVTLYTSSTSRLTISSTGTMDAAGNPITNCPTTAKAWVNFNGSATDYTSGNTVTYSAGASTTTVTITRASHTVAVGDSVTVSGVTGATGVNGTYQVTAITGTTIVYVVPSVVTGTVAGTAVVRVATIRSSYNVSSITKNGTGDYAVNFATAMADANYSTQVSISGAINTAYVSPILNGQATSLVGIVCLNVNNGALKADPLFVSVQVFGN
jgi:hypothetical protein